MPLFEEQQQERDMDEVSGGVSGVRKEAGSRGVTTSNTALLAGQVEGTRINGTRVISFYRRAAVFVCVDNL